VPDDGFHCAPRPPVYIRAMITLLLSVAALAGDSVRPGVVAPEDSLRQRIEARIATVPGARVGVVLHDLRDRFQVAIAADSTFHAASTMKLPVMIELFRQVDAGHLSLDQSLLVVNSFGSIVDGSNYALDPGDDSDSSLYAMVGKRVPVRDLIEHMITRSSNLATNTLIPVAGATNANATAHALGATRMRVLRGVEDGKAFALGMNNTTTASDLTALLLAIERGTAASPASCTRMREILLREIYSGDIPAGLPAGTPVAQKTGSITGVLHDAAIVYPPGRTPYVLVVLTSNIPDEANARALTVDISRMVWEFVSAR
jgi:beta-lactamase class A